jgi:hypothetical protein
MVTGKVEFMQFRKHGMKVQCLRSNYCKEKGYNLKIQVFSFPSTATSIEGIDTLLLNKLTEHEIGELKSYLSEEDNFLSTLIEDIDTCRFKFMKKSMVRKIGKSKILEELEAAIFRLQTSIRKLK